MSSKKIALIMAVICLILSCKKQRPDTSYVNFEPTQESAKPWVYWYWMQNAYSKEGITADLQAMKDAGLAGAYLMTIKGSTTPPLIDPPIAQLSPEFWEMIKWAFQEAQRLDLKLAFHAADGFAVAGGPWITPDQSMQKVVWADTIVVGGKRTVITLPTPQHYKDYYQDIATFAIPINDTLQTSSNLNPVLRSSTQEDVSFLNKPRVDGNFKLYEKGWVEYKFSKPFTCKSIQIETKGNNYQAHRLQVEVSQDGQTYRNLGRLEAPRHGWQDTDCFYTHTIPATTAKYFRFNYDPEGTEPGAEDLDAAKWKQSLKVSKILLSNEALIDNYQGKSGAVWRISSRTSDNQIAKEDYVDLKAIKNLTENVNDNGELRWSPPSGRWRIVRFGHTSTGHTNATGGAGKGLEVDKFNPEAIRFQLDQWFGEAVRQIGPDLAKNVLSILHLDSWECGSQNWSPVFQNEFKLRRGYDVVDYLPLMAGIPIDDAQTSEQVLYDIRKTISELIADNFFGTLRSIANEQGVSFSSENVAPTMVSDALGHFKYVDFPGGEFWLKSPTHDKPNDMLDAISGGHIYDKNIIQAEAFTALRMDWDEHPGNLKLLADRNYALGINRFFYHVFVHNPWLDRKPGMTLDGIGTYFQRDQTWWEPGKAWVNYCERVQFQLQKGQPVVDLAVFTGEEIPSRSVLPDRLLPFIPNVFGKARLKIEEERRGNAGQPTAKMPKEVTYSKNTTDLSQWVNALNGYKYDSFNRDVLLEDAHVKNGAVYFKSDIAYKILVFPGARRMMPTSIMSISVLEKILKLAEAGATIMVGPKPESNPGKLSQDDLNNWQKLVDRIWDPNLNRIKQRELGKGTIVQLPYLGSDFKGLGISPDVMVLDSTFSRDDIAWTHRRSDTTERYFISNQSGDILNSTFSFRISGKRPYLYDPEKDTTKPLKKWKQINGRTLIPLKLETNQSLIVVFGENTQQPLENSGLNWTQYQVLDTLDETWDIKFDPQFAGPKKPISIHKLFDWSSSKNDSIKYYSGTAVYTQTFTNPIEYNKPVWLHFEDVANMAEVFLNGKNLGVAWTYPYRINLSSAMKKGANHLEIRVTNTWANRLIGDAQLPKENRLTWTTAPYRLEGTSLLKAGIFGPIFLETEIETENP